VLLAVREKRFVKRLQRRPLKDGNTVHGNGRKQKLSICKSTKTNFDGSDADPKIGVLTRRMNYENDILKIIFGGLNGNASINKHRGNQRSKKLSW
jgi:hypothetical protein